MSEQALTPWTVLRDGSRLVWRFVKRHPAAFAIAVLGAAMFAGAIIGASLAVGWVTDEVIIPILDGGAEPDLLPLAAALIIGVSVFKAVGIVIRRTAAGWFRFATTRDVRNELLAQQLSLKMSWFNRQAIGDLLAVADSDVEQGTGVLSPMPYATGVSMLLVGTIVMITAIDPWLGLGAVVGLLIVIAIDVHGSWITYGMWEEVQKGRGRVSSVAHESFDGALTVKALGREPYVSDRFQEVSDTLRDRIIEVSSTWTNYQVVIRALPQALIIVMLVVGAARIDAGVLTPGDVVTVAYLLSLLSFPIQLIGYVLWDLAGSLAGWQRVQAVFDADEHTEFGARQAIRKRRAAPVVGSTVGFGYDSEPVLSGLDLDIRAGTTLAVVGPTGSGKSTLCLLLARLWDPDTGAVHLEGRDLRTFAASELSKEVSYVAQDAFLFDTTVRGNITLEGEFSDEEVATAVALAGAESFISDLPEGLDTELGERGTTLSGGQRQRLALARALVRKPRLMILDDATSAVDPSVEAEILRALKSAALPSTIVVVAYRPSSIRLADEVVYVDDKTILGHGTHSELLHSLPAYARLVQAYEDEARRLQQEAS
ncbi:MAG: ABC transporter ATP-binding protein [Actinomycetota bacterium]|nr:ABC transporter ATP-binding protein [Actinomycetota bacterium]